MNEAISIRVYSLLAFSLVSGCGGLKLPDTLKPSERDWAMFGKTVSRTNATSEIVAPPLTLAWDHDITSSMGDGSPIVIDSTLIVTNRRGEMYAINAITGKRIGWVSLGDGIEGSPVIDGDVAYVAVTNSRETLIAYDMVGGKKIWKREYGDIETSLLLYNKKLYFGNTAGYFFCVELTNGELEWKFRLPDNTKRKGIRSTATASDSLVIFGADDGSIYALETRYGSERWSYETGAPVFASPSVSGGNVYCGNANGDFFALNAKDGSLAWKFAAGTSIYSTPAFTGKTILIGTTGGKLFGVNAETGAKSFETNLNSIINSSAVVSGDVAYVGTLKKELFAVNVHDGSIVWKQTVSGRIKTSPAIALGTVFVATDDKMILAFKSDVKK